MIEDYITEFMQHPGVRDLYESFCAERSLMPCPFCKKKDAKMVSGSDACWVECRACGAQGADHISEQAARCGWNDISSRVKSTLEEPPVAPNTPPPFFEKMEAKYFCPFCGKHHVRLIKDKGYSQLECGSCYSRGPKKMRLLEALGEWDSVSLIVKSVRGAE